MTNFEQIKEPKIEEPKKYNLNCSCGWIHLYILPGFICHNCGNVFVVKKPIAKQNNR